MNFHESYKMDELNTKARVVLETKGEKAFVEHVFTNPEDNDKPKEEKRQLSYAEMRMLYG
jgi:hypothetical protein